MENTTAQLCVWDELITIALIKIQPKLQINNWTFTLEFWKYLATYLFESLREIKNVIFNIILASFQSETGQDRPEKREKKNSFRFVPTRPELKNFQKNSKKLKKLKNIIMASLEAKTGRDKLKKRKKNRSDPFLPDPS